jgi:glycolate oxidase iron-sulfur subunit
MSKHKKLKDYEEQIRQCVKCGTCTAYCPVYGEEKKEPVVARGKIALAQARLEQDIELDKNVIADMSQCLLCGSCVDKCPNQVPTDLIVMAARREIADKKGLTSFGKTVSAVLKSQGLLNFLAKGGNAFSWLLFKKIPEESGLHFRFPVPFIAKNRVIPKIASKPFRKRHPQFIPGKSDKPLVAFFTGCMINYMYPEIGEAVLKTLRFLGMNIFIPEDQGCCGLPAFSSGDRATVEKLSKKNVAAFSKREPDFIVTACASCNAGIGRYYRELGPDYERFAEKVIDIHPFLVQQGLLEKLADLPKGKVLQKVTYHDPCHLRNQGITKEPRQVLENLPSVHFVEMEGSDRCCGLGGTFSVYHYDTSMKIGSKKVAGIKKSEADLVASACPGCIMQLQDVISHAGLPQKSIHVLELIARDLPDLPEQNLDQ